MTFKDMAVQYLRDFQLAMGRADAVRIGELFDRGELTEAASIIWHEVDTRKNELELSAGGEKHE